MNETTYFTRSLGGGGLMFESPTMIPMGTQLEVGLNVPVDCEKRMLRFMRIVAQVRWIGEMSEAVAYEGSNRYKVGVTFDEIDAEARACLDDYVKQRLRMASTQRVT